MSVRLTLAGLILSLLLSGCSVLGVERVFPAQGVAEPAIADPLQPDATQEVKVVELATPTLDLSTPTPQDPPAAVTPTPMQDFASLAQLGMEITTYQDTYAGFELDYPAFWLINAVPEDIRASAVVYTASLRSPKEPSAPKFQEGIPPDMAAIDVTVMGDKTLTYEQAVDERRTQTPMNEAGLTITLLNEQELVLNDGLKAHYFLYDMGPDLIIDPSGNNRTLSELVTVIDGRMVLLSGMGDQSLFIPVAATLREIKD